MAPINTVGPDGPHPRVLKELNSVIASALCGIFRAPLQCGDAVPSDWKRAYGYVTISYKKESRPVSLTCICSEIIEHMLVSNIVRHLESLHILIDFQHCCRQLNSCETQLIGDILCLNDFAKDMQNGGQTYVIVMDF